MTQPPSKELRRARIFGMLCWVILCGVQQRPLKFESARVAVEVPAIRDVRARSRNQTRLVGLKLKVKV